MVSMRLISFLFIALFAAVIAFSQDSVKEELIKRGHSHQGEAFDSGPRQKPWAIDGIGVAHFPITTKNQEVQKWFDQGHALIHSFWFYEAERALWQKLIDNGLYIGTTCTWKATTTTIF